MDGKLKTDGKRGRTNNGSAKSHRSVDHPTPMETGQSKVSSNCGSTKQGTGQVPVKGK